MKPIPLSKTLNTLLDDLPEGQKITVNWMISKTGGRGIYLVFIWLSLPFVVPVSLPGFSVVVGLVFLCLCWSMLFGEVGRLPRFIGDRPLPLNRESRFYRASMRFLVWLERWVKPRKSEWIHWQEVSTLNTLLLAFLAFLLVCPVPGVIPFTNSLPSYAVIAIAAGVMEEDGVCLSFGYILFLATCVYFILIAGSIIALLNRYYEDILFWLQQLI
jgi:hypothetical protein